MVSGECDSTVYMDIYCRFNLSNIPKTNYLITTFKDTDITCFVVHCSYFFDVNIEYQCQFSRQLKLQIGKKEDQFWFKIRNMNETKCHPNPKARQVMTKVNVCSYLEEVIYMHNAKAMQSCMHKRCLVGLFQNDMRHIIRTNPMSAADAYWDTYHKPQMGTIIVTVCDNYAGDIECKWWLCCRNIFEYPHPAWSRTHVTAHCAHRQYYNNMWRGFLYRHG